MNKFFISLTVLGLFLSGCSENNAEKSIKTAITEAENGQWKNALKAARSAVASDNNNISALLLQSVAAENCSDSILAVDSAAQALKINPDNFNALYTLGRLYSKDHSRLTEAMTLLNKAANIKKDDRNTMILLVNTANALNSERLPEYLEQLAKIDGALVDTFEYQTILGSAFLNQKNINRALGCFTKAYSKDKKNPIALYNFGVIMDFYLKKPTSAAQFYQHYLRNVVDNPANAATRKAVEERLKKIKK